MKILKSQLNQQQEILKKLAVFLVLTLFLLWCWQNRAIISEISRNLSLSNYLLLAILLTLTVVLSTFSFTLLVRSIGYPSWSFTESYHSLNFSQLGAMVPGKVWGYAGLVGSLWAHDIAKTDSLLIILLHTVLMLLGAAVVGVMGLASTIGLHYTLLILISIPLLIISLPWLDQLRSRFLQSSKPLPSPAQMFKVLGLAVLSWMVVSASFAWLVVDTTDSTGVFTLSASAFAAGYIAGYASLIVPAGLGVREGIIALILGPTLGADKAMATAVIFRIIHTGVLWLNIGVSLLCFSFRKSSASGIRNTTEDL